MADILVIDDNAVIRNILIFTLRDHYDVTVANNGKEAIATAASKQFDVIITDIVMPEMDGFEFVVEMRKNKSYAQTPILIVTANLQENKEKIKASGATGWLLKPFNPKKLLEAVDAVLK